jgi:hypothetical protein
MDGTAGRHVKRNKPVSKITSFFFSYTEYSFKKRCEHRRGTSRRVRGTKEDSGRVSKIKGHYTHI